jgi:hypothetical protein
MYPPQQGGFILSKTSKAQYTVFATKPRLRGHITLWRVLPMSISSKSTDESNREEAIKLLISAIQFPASYPFAGDSIATELVRGADILLEYVQSGKFLAPTAGPTDKAN